jgi:hypothetical protein
MDLEKSTNMPRDDGDMEDEETTVLLAENDDGQ